jgi:hypothetical protein
MLRKPISIVSFLLVLINILTFLSIFVQGATVVTVPTIKIEGEWCEQLNGSFTVDGSNILENDLFSNSKALYLNNTATMPQDGYSAGYDVAINREGYYKFSFLTSEQGKKSGQLGGNTNWSSYSLDINGEQLNLDPASYGMNSSINSMSFNKYSLTIKLKQGANCIKFVVKDQMLSDGSTYKFALDYFTLDIVESSTIRVEGEAVSDSVYTDMGMEYGLYYSTTAPALFPTTGLDTATYTARTSAYLSGGKALYARNSSVQGAPGWGYQVLVKDSGLYNISVVCSELGVTTTSDFAIRVNHGENKTFDLNSTGFYYKQTVTGTDPTYLVKYALADPIYLEQGLNVIEFIANSSDTRTDGSFRVILDYFELNKFAQDITIEGESIVPPTGYATSNVAACSNSSCMAINRTYATPTPGVTPTVPIATPPPISYNVNIRETADYILYYSGTHSSGSSGVSPVDIKVDCNSITPFSKVGTLLGDPAWGKFIYGSAMTLNAGIHTISFTFSPKGTTVSSYYNQIDKIELINQANRELSKVDIVLQNPLLKIGDSSQINITAYDTLDGITTCTSEYSTENPEIASVSATGMVNALHPGKAKIKVVCTSGSITLMKDIDVFVVGTDGFELLTTSLNGSNLELSATSWYTADFTTTMCGTSYRLVNSVETSILSNNYFQNLQFNQGLVRKFSIPIQNLQSDHKVRLFIWDTISGMNPLWQPTIVNP